MLKYFVKLIVLIVAVALGRFAYEKVVDLPMFDLKEIRIGGDNNFDRDSLMAISGLEKGKSIYKQNLKFAADALYRQPGVVSCTVDRGLISNFGIDINIAKPSLLINCGKLYGLSKEGMVLPIDNQLPDLPLVSGRKFENVKCFDVLRDPDISYALKLYDALKVLSPELCLRLSEINFKGNNYMKLCLSPAGTEVIINKRFDESDLKRLCALQKSAILKGKNIYDLRFGSVVVESSMKKGTL